ncbi:unnamed protein product, partial [Hapterophycus canaliculatus]
MSVMYVCVVCMSLSHVRRGAVVGGNSSWGRFLLVAWRARYGGRGNGQKRKRARKKRDVACKQEASIARGVCVLLQGVGFGGVKGGMILHSRSLLYVPFPTFHRRSTVLCLAEEDLAASVVSCVFLWHGGVVWPRCSCRSVSLVVVGDGQHSSGRWMRAWSGICGDEEINRDNDEQN